MTKPSLPSLVNQFKTLGHPVRLRIMALLGHQELCVCQIVRVLDLANSTVSEHLRALRIAGFISEHKKGRWVHYRRTDTACNLWVMEGLDHSLSGDALIESDHLTLQSVLAMPREQVCQANSAKDCTS